MPRRTAKQRTACPRRDSNPRYRSSAKTLEEGRKAQRNRKPGRIKGWRSPEQVAEILELSRSSVYRLIHNGPLVASRIGGLLRVHSDDLDQFLKRGRVR